ncbi:hypothetical protein NUU61_008164 [Penicillium alfredii]|uniref:Uncharacterized protein n=1 Tax=Penicillium alfredii TaxID=1506179 RepID=A0A9W9ERU9_9EURO|nr:uncharacterized protein NUU61_008164 [Penicillium alfredii]KAJ5086857.1 hypothetical protein NUU61_008164 [Penicillium alfredii]
MKRLCQALLALSLTCGVWAESQGRKGPNVISDTRKKTPANPSPCTDEKQCVRELQTVSVAEVVVWVNEQGAPISTETSHSPTTTTHIVKCHDVSSFVPQPSISSSDSDASSSSSAQGAPRPDAGVTDRVGPANEEQRKPHPPAHPPPPPPPPPHAPPHPHPDAHPKPPVHPHGHSDGHPALPRKFGISYSPYNADKSCKTQAEVDKDLDKLPQYSFIRIYGTDCDQTRTVTAAARRHHMQVFAGLYDLSGFPDSLKPISEAAATGPDGKKDWSIFHTIAIGNELINGGKTDPARVTAAVNKARSILRDQGYEGPVVTVDAFSVLLKHPELCHASDYCAANCHAFFDASQQPDHAGSFALHKALAVSEAAGGKHTIITESGWPHGGNANGAAVPSPENQQAAIASLRKTERFWGIQSGP